MLTANDPKTRFFSHIVPDFQKKTEEIKRIAGIPFHHFVHDSDELTVALYAGDIAETAFCMNFPEESIERVAAEKAKRFYLDSNSVIVAANAKYFEAHLKGLLKLAKSDPDYGAKLAQVFCCFVEYHGMHNLSRALVEKMEEFIESKGAKDGFIIYGQDKGDIYETFYV